MKYMKYIHFVCFTYLFLMYFIFFSYFGEHPPRTLLRSPVDYKMLSIRAKEAPNTNMGFRGIPHPRNRCDCMHGSQEKLITLQVRLGLRRTCLYRSMINPL